MSEHLLEVKNLQTNFRTGGGIVQAVRGIDLYVDAGEFLGIIGEYLRQVVMNQKNMMIVQWQKINIMNY